MIAKEWVFKVILLQVIEPVGITDKVIKQVQFSSDLLRKQRNVSSYN